MNAFFRQNQKKLLAFFGVLLMVAWSATSFVGGRNTPEQLGKRTVGTVNGAKVSAAELLSAKQSWETLNRLQFTDPNDPNEQYAKMMGQVSSIAQRIFGPAIIQTINRNPDAFFLLLREARDQGVPVSNDLLQSLLKNNIVDVPEDEAQQARVVQALSDGLAVRGLLNRVGDVVKVSQPERQRALATSDQQISLRVVEFPAASYQDKVSPPTTQQVQNQYDQFKDHLPEQYDPPTDPLGFGYKLPDRVAFDFIALPKPELIAAAKAGKDEVTWTVDALRRFKDQRDYYDGKPIATQPTTGPSTAPSPFAAGPTTRRAEDVAQDFDLHKQFVLDDLYNDEAAKLAQTIVKQMRDTMNADYVAWSEAQKAAGPATRPSGSVGVAYDDPAYLSALAASVEKQFHVRPTVGQAPQLRALKELSDIPNTNIAKASFESGRQPIPFPEYALLFAEPIMPATIKSGPYGSFKLTVEQPSQPLTDDAGTTYLFRLTKVDPSHTAPFDEVKAQVEHDVRLKEAYEQARQAAAALQATAKTQGLASAAGNGLLVVTTDKFAQSVAQSQNPKISPLTLKPASVPALVTDGFKLLASADPHRVGLSELYPDATVAVIELAGATPGWTPATATELEAQAAQQIARQQQAVLEARWCDYDALKSRLNYQPEASAKSVD